MPCGAAPPARAGVINLAATALLDEPSSTAYQCKKKYPASSIVEFDEVLGSAADASSLFTCAREHPSLTMPSTYPHKTPNSSPRPTPLSMSDVAIGMPVAGSWISPSVEPAAFDGSASSAALHACSRGDLLACARRTWMAGPLGRQLEVMLLADCSPLCSRAAEQSATHLFDGLFGGSKKTGARAAAAATASSSSSSSFSAEWRLAGCRAKSERVAQAWEFDTPFRFGHVSPWLKATPQLATLHMRCYWGQYRGLGLSYQKTFVLLKAMLERVRPKRFYLKLDADALLRPPNLLRFLTFLHSQVDATSPLYFGSAFGTYNCTGHTDSCRSYRVRAACVAPHT
jgi:hypothetical protein